MQATKKQIDLIKKLYEQIGQEVEDDVELLDRAQASQRIEELMKFKQKFEPKDDGRYWY